MRETRFTFDERRNQLTRHLPGGETEHAAFNDFGQQTLHISFEGVVTELVYDNTAGGGGRLIEKRFFPDVPSYDTYVADSVANPPAETISVSYDAFGREVQVIQDDGTVVRTTSTSYDAEGRIASISSPEGIVHYEYDSVGRKTRTYTVDPADPQNVTNDFRYAYDPLGRLQAVEVWERNDVPVDADGDPANGQQPESTRYAYDLAGNLDRTDLPDGVVTDYVYDELNRLEKLTQFASDDTPETLADNERLAEFVYTLRADGRRTQAVETFWWDDNADQILDPHQNTMTWDYDDLGRLTDEVFASYDEFLEYADQFTHDLTGNRRQKTRDWVDPGKPDETVRYQYDSNDRLLSEELDTTGDGQPESVTAYGYTGTHQASKEVTVGGVLARRETFGYDLQGRMDEATIEAHDSSTGALLTRERTTYEYDANGTRVSALHETDGDLDSLYGGTNDTATKTEYLSDPHNFTGYAQVLQETELNPSTGEVLKRTVYAIGHDVISQTVTEYTGGVPGAATTSFFGYDGHGSTRVLFDMAGAIATILGIRQVFGYDAHGNLLKMLPSEAATSLLYSGELFDARIGQQYLRARWYDPLAGRFNRLDPFFGNVRDPQTLHKYLYANGDPITFVDPSGNFGLIGLAIAGGIRTAMVGMYVGVIAGVYASLVAGNLVHQPLAPIPLAQLEQDDDYALLADAAYENSDYAAIEAAGWGEVKDYEDFKTGFRAVLFRRTDGSEQVFAYAGTNFFNLTGDWVSNVMQGMLGVAPQYTQAIEFAGVAMYDDGFGPIDRFVGHSLGGGLASLAAIVFNKPATTFNAAGLHRNTGQPFNATLDNANALIDAYRVQGEILSTLQDGRFPTGLLGLFFLKIAILLEVVGAVMPDSIGTTYWLPATSWMPWSRHGMAEVLAGIDRMKAQ